jgi:hypothetical protein
MAKPVDGDPFEADERFEFAPLARAALWASLAALAVFGAVLAAQSEAGSKRLAAAMGSLPGSGRTAVAAQTPAARAGPASSALEAEIGRLADGVRAMTERHDRLVARIEVLERGLDVTASVPPANRGAAGEAIRTAEPTRGEFGLDLGPGTTVEALRGQWTTIRAQHGAVLDGLRPLVAVREAGGAFELRLIVGPLANAPAAARLCAVIGATGRPCQPAAFEGQRLALR